MYQIYVRDAAISNYQQILNLKLSIESEVFKRAHVVCSAIKIVDRFDDICYIII